MSADTCDVNYRWIVLLVIFCSQFVLSVAAYGWGPLAPFLKKALSLDNTQIGIISSSFLLAGSVSVFPAGIMVDRYGVRMGLLTWLGLTGLPLFVLSFVHYYYWLILVMVALSGCGYAMGNPAGAKGLYIWFDPKTRGTVFGVRQAAVTLGGALAGILLVNIAQVHGPFVALRAVCWMIVAMIVLTLLLYREPESDKDTRGATGSGGTRSFGAGLRGVIGNAALVKVSMIAAMLGVAQGAVVTFFLLYVNERLGYSLVAAGSLFCTLMISGAAGRVLWGVVSDRVFHGSRKPVLMTISGVGVVSTTLLALWGGSWPHRLFLPVVIGIGLSSWGWNGLYFVLVAELSDPARAATSVGFAATFGWFGVAVGPTGFGSLADHWGYCCAWMFPTVCFFVALLLCLLIPASHGSVVEEATGTLNE